MNGLRPRAFAKDPPLIVPLGLPPAPAASPSPSLALVHLRLHTHYASTAQGCHPGITCDKTGQCPIVGWRFHLIGKDYDLCEAEFNKLPDAEKANYEKIAPPRPARAAQSEALTAERASDPAPREQGADE